MSASSVVGAVPADMTFAPEREPLFAWRRKALLTAGIAGVACLAGAILDLGAFLEAWLLAFVLWTGVTLGCLAILMLQHLTGGVWGIVARRVLEAGARTLPLAAIAFLPVLAGVRRLYPWASHGMMEADPLLAAKAAYLNVPFFALRAAVCFAVWGLFVRLLVAWSWAQDEGDQTRGNQPRLQARFQKLAGAGILAYGVTMTFAAVDWLMSLEPHWFSTLYGALIMVGQVLSAFAFAIAALVALRAQPAYAGTLKPGHYHDLGKLLFAFIMLWAYFSFSQYLIIWSANLPEETPWYLHRLSHGWQGVAAALVALHFFLPFALLLSRDVKRNPRLLGWIAAGILVLRYVDLYWLVAPDFRGGLALHWLDAAAPVALGGAWVALFLTRLAERPLLPYNDPAFAAVEHSA